MITGLKKVAKADSDLMRLMKSLIKINQNCKLWTIDSRSIGLSRLVHIGGQFWLHCLFLMVMAEMLAARINQTIGSLNLFFH